MTKIKKLLEKGINSFPLRPISRYIKGETHIFWQDPKETTTIPAGIGMEIEMGHIPNVSSAHRDWLFDLDIFGEIKAPNRYNPNGSIKLELDSRKIALEQLPIIYKIIGPNASPLISREMFADKTVNDGKGGPEANFSPVTLDSLPVVKLEMIRFLYYMKKMGCYWQLPDVSSHMHASKEMLGDNDLERENTLTNFIWLLYGLRDFLPSFSNRIGDGIQIADLHNYLDDPFKEKNEKALMRTFMLQKKTALELLRDRGQWKDDAVQNSDNRWKGLMNMTFLNEHDTFEFRWFGGPKDNIDIQVMAADTMSFYEWYFASLDYSRLSGVMATKDSDTILEGWVAFVQDHRETYPHLFNRLFEQDLTKILLTENPIELLKYNLEDILNFEYEKLSFMPVSEWDKKQCEETQEHCEKAQTLTEIIENVTKHLEVKETTITSEDIFKYPLTEGWEPGQYRSSLTGKIYQYIHDETKTRFVYNTKIDKNQFLIFDNSETPIFLKRLADDIYRGMLKAHKLDIEVHLDYDDDFDYLEINGIDPEYKYPHELLILNSNIDHLFLKSDFEHIEEEYGVTLSNTSGYEEFIESHFKLENVDISDYTLDEMIEEMTCIDETIKDLLIEEIADNKLHFRYRNIDPEYICINKCFEYMGRAPYNEAIISTLLTGSGSSITVSAPGSTFHSYP